MQTQVPMRVGRKGKHTVSERSAARIRSGCNHLLQLRGLTVVKH